MSVLKTGDKEGKGGGHSMLFSVIVSSHTSDLKFGTPVSALLEANNPPPPHSLVGLVVKSSAFEAEDPGFQSCWRQDFSGSSHTSDSRIGAPVATLPGAWHYSQRWVR